ncbi:MAG: polysaccharide deacetylase family protein [Flavobacteriales bacterium]|jgi:hypothetical protein|nr:polysaccharide deacetylase family protein [Flavobacteriales bacterium]
MEILIYSQHKTSRVAYTFKQVFSVLLKIPYRITQDLQEFVSYNGPKFSYANKTIHQDLHFHAQGLLWEKGIGYPEIILGYHKSTPCIFQHGNHESALNFDPFSAIFFFLSRYEEYWAHIKDTHGRFPAKESFLYENGLLEKPLVDIWALLVFEKIQEKYPEIPKPKRSFKAINSLDIDSAYAYRAKGILRTTGILAKKLFRFELGAIFEIISVLLKRKKDPYDTFDFIIKKRKEYPKVDHLFFILLGEYDTYDTNIHPKQKSFQSIIKSLADYGKVGIHPSYRSNTDIQILKKEIKTLQNIIHREVENSRQHFLKLTIPDTYRNLIENNIETDYTMGYASVNGFRAATCTPFAFYDLDLEYETPLQITPFCVMESSLYYYQKLNPQEAKASINRLVEEVKNVDGTFVSLWHNESLSETGHWQGWQSVYEHLIKKMNDALD